MTVAERTDFLTVNLFHLQYKFFEAGGGAEHVLLTTVYAKTELDYYSLFCKVLSYLAEGRVFTRHKIYVGESAFHFQKFQGACVEGFERFADVYYNRHA